MRFIPLTYIRVWRVCAFVVVDVVVVEQVMEKEKEEEEEEGQR